MHVNTQRVRVPSVCVIYDLTHPQWINDTVNLKLAS